ncbi:aminotransferase class III-fold pyridoxal phosphate-dependent enzyme [Actinomadura welshii]
MGRSRVRRDSHRRQAVGGDSEYGQHHITSNLYATEPGITLAEELVALLGADTRTRVFFCNSGTEANELAFKLSRLTGRTKLVAAQAAFHGRTMGSLALTGQPAKQAAFQEAVRVGDEYSVLASVRYLSGFSMSRVVR